MSFSINGTSGVTYPDASTQATAGFTGFRNRIINGGMVIDQRNAGASVTVDSATLYTLDRWNCTEIGNGVFTTQQVTDAPSGFTKSLKITTTTAQTGTLNASARQSVEGYNIADLGWGAVGASTVTLSFWVKSSLTGTFGGALRNSASDRSYVFSYTIAAANTWEQKTVTITGDTTGTWLTDNSTGVIVWFSLGTGATNTAGAWYAGDYRGATGQVNVVANLSATWQITGVQLEKGSTATPFEFRPYGTELQLCQRYFAKTFPQGTAVAQGAGESNALDLPINPTAGTSGLLWTQWVYPVIMRTSPTITLYNPSAANSNWRNSAGTADCTSSLGQQSDRVVQVRAANVITGQGAYIHLAASAEL